MFRKIHSNRDPRDTVFSEIKKEFGYHFGKAGTGCRNVLERYPRVIFRVMLFVMVLSMFLSWRASRNRALVSVHATGPTKVQPASLNDGFSRILQVSSALREMIALKKQVDSLTSKRALSHQDSLALEGDLDRLQQINEQQNQKHNGH